MSVEIQEEMLSRFQRLTSTLSQEGQWTKRRTKSAIDIHRLKMSEKIASVIPSKFQEEFRPGIDHLWVLRS
jgi:hypothetical protein